MKPPRSIFGLKKSSAIAFAIIPPSSKASPSSYATSSYESSEDREPSSSEFLRVTTTATGTEESVGICTPPARPASVPNIFVYTPEAASYCAFRADEPLTPPTPDLDKLNAALEILEQLSESTPAFARPAGRSLEDIVIMPKRKASVDDITVRGDEGMRSRPNIVIGRNDAVVGPSKKGSSRVAKAFKGLFKSKHSATGPMKGENASPYCLPGQREGSKVAFSCESIVYPGISATPVSSPVDPFAVESFSFLLLDDALTAIPTEPAPRKRKPSIPKLFTRRPVFASEKGRQSSPYLPFGDVTNESTPVTPGGAKSAGLVSPYSKKAFGLSTHSLPHAKAKRANLRWATVTNEPEEEVPPLPSLQLLTRAQHVLALPTPPHSNSSSPSKSSTVYSSSSTANSFPLRSPIMLDCEVRHPASSPPPRPPRPVSLRLTPPPIMTMETPPLFPPKRAEPSTPKQGRHPAGLYPELTSSPTSTTAAATPSPPFSFSNFQRTWGNMSPGSSPSSTPRSFLARMTTASSPGSPLRYGGRRGGVVVDDDESFVSPVLEAERPPLTMAKLQSLHFSDLGIDLDAF